MVGKFKKGVDNSTPLIYNKDTKKGKRGKTKWIILYRMLIK